MNTILKSLLKELTTQNCYEIPGELFHVFNRERMCGIQRLDEGAGLWRVSVPHTDNKTVGYVVHVYDEAAEEAVYHWFSSAYIAISYYMRLSEAAVKEWRQADAENERSADMHEKEKYHLGPNDELLVDCKGGPVNVVLKDLTEEEKKKHAELLLQKYPEQAKPVENTAAPNTQPPPATEETGPAPAGDLPAEGEGMDTPATDSPDTPDEDPEAAEPINEDEKGE